MGCVDAFPIGNVAAFRDHYDKAGLGFFGAFIEHPFGSAEQIGSARSRVSRNISMLLLSSFCSR